MYYLVQTDNDILTVEPWPFEDKKFNISFEFRIIKQLQFTSSADFRKAFLKAPVEEKLWKLQRQVIQPKANKVKV